MNHFIKTIEGKLYNLAHVVSIETRERSDGIHEIRIVVHLPHQQMNAVHPVLQGTKEECQKALAKIEKGLTLLHLTPPKPRAPKRATGEQKIDPDEV